MDFDDMTVAEMARMAADNKLFLLGAASILVFLILWIADVLKPGAIAKSGMRDVSPFQAPMWLFAGFLILAASIFASSFLAQQEWATGPDPESLRGKAGVFAGTYILAGLVALGMVGLFSRSASGAGLKLRLVDIPIGICCFALAWPVVELAGAGAVQGHEFLTKETAQTIAHPTLQIITDNAQDPLIWVIVASVVIGAPIVEEIIYRVFLQSAVLRWSGSPWLAILISSLVFTGMHFDWQSPQDFPYYTLAPLLVLGLAMGLAYERTRRLGVPIVIHAAFNAMNVYMGLRLEGVVP
jgi:membrane protease YdiL (CAAX protease family)